MLTLTQRIERKQRQMQRTQRVINTLSVVQENVRQQQLNDSESPATSVLSFREFIGQVSPRYKFYPHVEKLISVCQRIADGELKRVMVFMPPRHGKSETVSRLFPAYLCYRFPEKWTAISSYAADIAYGFSRNARDFYTRGGGELKQDAAAVKNWETGKGGGLWACGVGGPATGRGFHFGIVDDPLKNAEEAASMTIRNKQWDWWGSTWSTREEPGAAMLVVQTRWHEDDLSGRLLDAEAEEDTEDAEGWHIVNFEAVKEAEPMKVPASCTLEEDDRKPGEPLCPDRYSLKWLLKKAKKLGSYFWNALYQQRPAPIAGALWKRHWFEGNTFTEAPAALRNVGYDWDTAYTENERNSATAYVKAGKDAEGNVYVLDAGYRFLETPAAEQWMAEIGGPHYVEQKASGKSLVQGLRRRGIAAVEVPIRGGGDKYARTTQVTPYAEAGTVKIAAHLLDRLLNDEKQGILKFPNGSHDDVNDALVQALNRLYPLNQLVRRHHRGGRQ